MRQRHSLSDETGKSPEPLPVFAIGDVHGHYDRLVALLAKADVTDQDCIVVQCGDLGHFGRDTQAGDLACWTAVYKREVKVDIVLWGNHDRAVIDTNHGFSGYKSPGQEIKHMMRAMEADGRLRMAYAAHGWLLTHAGLHAQIKYNPLPEDVDRTDAESMALYLCGLGHQTDAILDAVGRSRGGWSPYGGILWRDIAEALWSGVPQVFGHSASSQHVVRGEQDKWYCIDIGAKGGPVDTDANCLAGIWLPTQEIVRVDLGTEGK